MTLAELNEIKKSYKVLELAVDFINPSYNIFRAKHLDNSRYIVCTLTENGIPRKVKTDEVARIRLQKPDRTHVYNDCAVLEDGRVFIILTEQILAVEGNALCDIQLVNECTEVIYSTKNFIINIDKTAVNNSIIASSDEFDALNKLIATNKKINEELKANEKVRQENENERINNENERKENETDRQNAETERVKAENIRKANETVRIGNENTRKANEIVRQNQESVRQTNTAAAIQNAEKATKKANDVADDLQHKLDTHHFVLTEDKDIAGGVPSLDSNKKVPVAELYEATTTSKGITQLTDSVASTSTTTAATPKSVKTAYDKAVTVENDLNAHNSSSTAHNDIRTLIANLTTRLNTLADSDDTTLDQLSEIVAYIKNNKSLIDGITTSKVNVSDIIDNLTSSAMNKPLSAKQGKVLNDLITALTATVNTRADATALTNHVNDDVRHNKVTQQNTSANADIRLLLSGNANDTNETNYVKKSNQFLANPSTGELYARGYRRIDITGKTLDVNTLNLGSGTPNIMRYIEKTDGGCANITNIPVTGKPFLLDVEIIRWASTIDYITIQTFRNASDYTHEYVRICTNGTWTAWQKRIFTDTNTTYNNVTQSVSGLMSNTDKKKLDGIAEGANKTVVDTALSDSSTNPVQNKVVKNTLDKKLSASGAYVSSQNTSNYPWHRIAYSSVSTGTFTDKDVIIMLKGGYSTGSFGILKVSTRANGSGQVGSCIIEWIIRKGYNVDSVRAGFHNVSGDVYADLFLYVGPYARTDVTLLRGLGGSGWEICSSLESTNGQKGENVYSGIESAATEIRGKAYSTIVVAQDSAAVNLANKVMGTLTDPTTETAYYPVFVPAQATAAKDIRQNEDFKVTIRKDRSQGKVRLELGNSAIGGASDAYKNGILRLYSAYSNYVDLVAGGGSGVANATIILPATSGTLCLTSHTHNSMTAATASAAGKEGFVPAPPAGSQDKFLCGDGTWKEAAQSKISKTINTAYISNNGYNSVCGSFSTDDIGKTGLFNVQLTHGYTGLTYAELIILIQSSPRGLIIKIANVLSGVSGFAASSAAEGKGYYSFDDDKTSMSLGFITSDSSLQSTTRIYVTEL